MSALRSQRRPNAKFIGPLCHRVGDHAVQPDGAEGQREPRKNAKDPRREMLLLPLGFISQASFEIMSATDLIRVNGPQLPAHGMLQREGRNLRTNQNLRALSHAERIGHVDGWSRGTSESIIAGVPGDAHNLEPSSSDIWRRQHCGGIAFETSRSQRVPNGIAIRKVALRQRTVDYGYMCTFVILGVAQNRLHAPAKCRRSLRVKELLSTSRCAGRNRGAGGSAGRTPSLRSPQLRATIMSGLPAR